MIPFPGTGQNSFRYDKAAVETINAALFERESGLYQTKWFDYRQMHPTEATYASAAAYKKAFKAEIGRKQDIHAAKHIKILKHVDLFLNNHKTVANFWRARQAADFLGMPYDFYYDTAMRFSREMKWNFHVPWPQQTYSTKVHEKGEISIIAYIQKKWIERRSTHIVHASTDFYLLENFDGHPDQQAHIDYIVDQMKAKQNPWLAVASYVYEKPLIPESAIIETFGKERGNELLVRAQNFLL